MYRAAIESALNDPLTGTGNRLALENTLEREVNLSLRHKTPLSLVVVDIDNFKSVNDNHGHAIGDEVLKRVAKQINHCYRDTDAAYRAYRYGGEEFVIILNKTDNEGAVLVGERIRESVEALEIAIENLQIKITVSIGAASLLTDDTMSRLFQRADKALYKAKHQGRNRTVSAKTLHLEPEDKLIK
jgi:diguanylate cyclase (GGDEF)-like protein